LSARECAILGLVRRGYSNKRIALELRIAPETVKSHAKHIFLKLGARDPRGRGVARRESRLGFEPCYPAHNKGLNGVGMPLFSAFSDSIRSIRPSGEQTAGSAEEPVFLNPQSLRAAAVPHREQRPARLRMKSCSTYCGRNVHVQTRSHQEPHTCDSYGHWGDSPRESRYIETVRKRGYRFVASLSDSRARGGRARRAGARQQLLSAARGRCGNCRTRSSWPRAARPQLVFVTGEPGIGKTALLDQFSAAVGAKHDVLCSIGRCIEGYGGVEPYYPVLEALTRLARGRPGDSLVQALVAIAPSWAVQLPGVLTRENTGGAPGGRPRGPRAPANGP